MARQKHTTAKELEFYAQMGKKVFDPDEQETFLEMWSGGWHRDSILRKMHKSNVTLQRTLKEVPEFAETYKETTTRRYKDVEVEAFRGANGMWFTEKLEYRTAFDDAGKPLLDKKGDVKMVLFSKVVTKHPPEWKVIEFILRARMPEIYGSKALQYDSPTEAIDVLKVLLGGKLKEMGASVEHQRVAIEIETKDKV